jgi:hypothetical protein
LKTLVEKYQAMITAKMLHEDDKVLSPTNISKRVIKRLTDLLSSYQLWQQTLEVNVQGNDWLETLEKIINIFQDGLDAWSVANKDLDNWLNNLGGMG